MAARGAEGCRGLALVDLLDYLFVVSVLVACCFSEPANLLLANESRGPPGRGGRSTLRQVLWDLGERLPVPTGFDYKSAGVGDTTSVL